MDSANNSLRQVSVDVHAPASDAYASLKTQFDQLQSCPQNARSEAKPGMAMTESEIDKLSLVWLSEKSNTLGRDVTKADLAAPQASQLDSIMAAHVAKQYETIRHAHADLEGGFLTIGAKEKDALTREDIDASLKTADKQRELMAYADPLMANNGALFYELSKVHDGVRSVNYWDLKEAREVDDYQHSKGKTLFTPQQRALIDQMYQHWGKADMRALEERPQGSSMGCDGDITAETLARGTGFQSAQEMSEVFNRPNWLITPAEYCADQEAARQQGIIQNARKMWLAQKEAIQEQSYYAVKPGQGFDRIARQVLTTENDAVPAEPDVLKYSKSIAQMNGFDRDSYSPQKRSLQPGQSIQVHDADWQLGKVTESIGVIDDYVRESIDNKQ